MPSTLRKNHATYDNFRGGINEGVSSFIIEDNELAFVRNFDLELGGSVRGRRRQETFTDMTNSDTGGKVPIYKMHRYTTGAGDNKKVIAFGSTGYLLKDDGYTGKFLYLSGAEATSALASATRFCGMAQFRDTVYISTEQDIVKSYNPLDGSSVLRDCSSSGLCEDVHISASPGVGITRQDGTLESNRYYMYGFTVEIYHGNNFVCETNALQDRNLVYPGTTSAAVINQYVRTYALTSNILIYKHIHLRKNTTETFDEIPGAKKINVYRSLPIHPSDFNTDKEDFYEHQFPNLYYLCSISVDDYNAASFGDYLMTDVGNIDVDITMPIPYSFRSEPPPSRFLCYHKNRMWYAYSKIYDDVLGSYTTHTSRVYYSEYLQPQNVYPLSWKEINPHDGDDITGMVSWNNKALIIFKDSSMWAIPGSDEENVGQAPTIQPEAIDMSIGCVAPETIAFVDGMMIWLSNRGPYFFDGSYPRELKSDNLREILLRMVPNSKYNAVGHFNSHRRTYYMALEDPNVISTPGVNNTVLKFDLKHGAWMRHQRDGVGIGSFLELRRRDDQPTLLAGLDASDTVIGEQGSVIRYDHGNSGQDIGVAANGDDDEAIDLELRTKYFDCGRADVDKQFLAVEIQYKANTNFSLDYMVDNHYDSSTASPATTKTLDTTSASGSAVWGTPDWNDFTWASVGYVSKHFMLDTNAWGKRIAFKVSGTNSAFRPKIQRITVYFNVKERMRK